MPVSTSENQSSPFVGPAGATVPALAEPPAFIGSLPPALGLAERRVLRVGEYQVGETCCPQLFGHPDIRY